MPSRRPLPRCAPASVSRNCEFDLFSSTIDPKLGDLLFNSTVTRVGWLKSDRAPDRCLCFLLLPQLAVRQRQVTPACRRVRKKLHGLCSGHFAFFPSTKLRKAPGKLEPRFAVHGRELQYVEEM